MDTSSLIAVLKRHQPDFSTVVVFDPAKEQLLPLDFTAANTELDQELLSDTTRFTGWVQEQLTAAHARYGIGGYGEHRTVYAISKVFDAEKPGEEPRRLHLGTDIWGKPNEAVMAPLTGIVHSFAFNNRPGDYGATIILSHCLDERNFYTLYGHLSLHAIQNIRKGDRIEKGELFAAFGIPSENGQWPPHLHFQVIDDLGDWSGDYPGVCQFSQKEEWLQNCPDPDLLLQLNQYIKK